MSGPQIEHPLGAAPGRRGGVILLVVLAGGVGLNHALIHPLRDYLLDFRAYYAAGRALHLGLDPYDTAAVRRHVDLPGRQAIVPYLYPPPTLALASGVALLPYPAAQVPWCLFQYALILGGLGLVLRAVGCPLGSPTSVLIGFVFLTSAAVEQLFRWGQFDMVVLALLAAAFLALRRGQAGWAGGAVGLAVVAKVTPLLYLAVFLVRKEGKALVASTLTVALLMGGSHAVLGGGIFETWVQSLRGLSNDLTTLLSPENMSLQAFVYRGLVAHLGSDGPSTPWLDLGPGVARGVALGLLAIIVAATAWWMLRHRRALSTAECLAAAIPVALLASPVTWAHHGVQLLIPLALITVMTVRQSRLGGLDVSWLVLTLLLYTNWPVERFGLGLPSWLAHLAGPTMTYATGLMWLFMVVRYVPLKRAAEATRQATRTAVQRRPESDIAEPSPQSGSPTDPRPSAPAPPASPEPVHS